MLAAMTPEQFSERVGMELLDRDAATDRFVVDDPGTHDFFDRRFEGV